MYTKSQTLYTNVNFYKQTMRTSELIKILTGVSTTSTSAAIPFADVKMGTIVLTGAAIANRTGTLKIQGTVDETNYYDLNILVDNAAGASGLTTTIANKALAATGTAILFIPELSPFKYIKVVLTVADGGSPAGTFTVQLYKQYNESD